MNRPQLGRGVIIIMNVQLCLQRFKVFSTNSPIDTLHNIATMDLATEDIQ